MIPDPVFKPGHNTPPHLFVADWPYMLTGATYKRQPFIRSEARKKEWISAFLSASEIYHWKVFAWVVFDNHYHAILKSPDNGIANLPKFVSSFHKYTARHWNDQENETSRMVWWNYWDTCIKSQEDYLKRLQYVFWNPVKHGFVDEPSEYAYSNYNDFLKHEWFEIGSNPVEVENVPEF
jgi:putative transposase